jgi:hypothetical protein
MNVSKKSLLFLALAIAGLLMTQTANAGVCIITDNQLPPNCSEGYLGDVPMLIVDGLPPGTTIELVPQYNEFFNISRSPGGNLGGEIEQFESPLYLEMTGTGSLTGFHRSLAIPVFSEVHTAPRNPGDAVQDFDTEMVQLQGEILGDPDFDLLSVRAGSAFGLPSPGHTTITDLNNGTWNVDSFFDVVYQIDFQGAPGSILEGFDGTTTASFRLVAGQPIPEPSSILLLAIGGIGGMIGLVRRYRQTQ